MAAGGVTLSEQYPLVAVLDANVLYPPLLRDIMLAISTAGLYEAKWSAEILEETERNLARHLGPETARSRVTSLREIAPDAEVEKCEIHLPDLTNHPKDRHVVAAAIECHATVIVTGNLKDFIPLPEGIVAMEPDAFLCLFLDQVDTLLHCLDEIRLRWPVSPTRDELLTRLTKFVPRFAASLRTEI